MHVCILYIILHYIKFRLDGREIKTRIKALRSEKWSIYGAALLTCHFGEFNSAWFVWKVGKNFIEEDPTYTSKGGKRYDIEPFSIEPGKYKVKFWVFQYDANEKTAYFNFDECYFEIFVLPLYAVIEGGTFRSVNFKGDLILDASKSLDPNEFHGNQDHLLYIWSCDNPELLHGHVIKKEKTYVIKGPLTPGRTCRITLKLDTDKHNIPVAVVNQTISTIESSGLSITFRCKKICDSQSHLSNPAEVLFFQAVSTPLVDYNLKGLSWTYSENQCGETPVGNIRQEDTYSQVLIVKKNKLQPGKEYCFRVAGSETGQKAEIRVKMSELPKMGKCTVTPNSGTAFETLFNIVCSGFDDDITPLLEYKFYDLKPNNDKNKKGTLLGVNTSGILNGVRLTGGVVIIYVTNLAGVFVKEAINIKVLPKKLTPEEINETLSIATTNQQNGDRAGSLSLLSLISDLLEGEQNKSSMSENILGIVSREKIYGIADILMVSNALTKIVSNGASNEVDGLSPTCAEYAAGIMKEFMKNLFHGILRKFSPLTRLNTIEVEQIVSSVVMCSDSLLNSRNAMLISKSEDAYRTNDIRKFEKATKDMIMSLVMATRVTGYYLVPSLSPVSVKTDQVHLWVKADSADRIINMTDFPGDENYTINFSPSLAKALEVRKGSVLLEIISFKRNPYWWSPEVAATETDVLLFKMSYEVKRGFVPITYLPEPLDIKFNFKGGNKEIVTGSVKLPDSNEHDNKKDLYVAVHRLNPMSDISNGRICIHFLNMTPSDSFKVQILQNVRPDYGSVMLNGRIVSSNSSEMYIDYTSVSPDIFTYIGILPGPQAEGGISVEYSFEIYSVHCLIRSGAVWSGVSAKVAGNTTQHKLHCLCQHLSIFGGMFRIPPNRISVLSDMSMFITIPDNPAVPLLITCLLTLFLILLAWSSWKDNRDKYQTIIFLEDNFPGDTWPYLIAIQTGFRFGAGTDSNVGIRLIGSKSSSRPHILRCSHHKILKRSNDDWFLILTEKHLGEIQELHIWQDYSGSSRSWYCVEIVVHDLSHQQTYEFIMDKWFSLEQKTYSVKAKVKASKLNEVNKRSRLITENTIFGFRESHTWSSIIFRHPRSAMRRTNRLAIAMCNVMTTMLTSIMFFGVGSNDSGVDFPVFSFSLKEIIIGLESSLISMPMTFCLVFCFRKSSFINVKSVEDEGIHSNIKHGNVWMLYSSILHRFVALTHLLPVKTTSEIKYVKNKKWYFLA